MRILLLITFIFASAVELKATSAEKTVIRGTINVRCRPVSEYSSYAKITLQNAISIATKNTPGKVIEATLNSKDGYLIYEIDLFLANKSNREILIDAGDGSILLIKDKSVFDIEDYPVEECHR